MPGIEQFAPYIFFDSNEVYFPSSIEYLASNLLFSNCSDYLYGFNTNDDLKNTPLYVFMENQNNNIIQFTYALFFPHQPQTYICGCIPWSYAPQTRTIRVSVDMKTQTIVRITIDDCDLDCRNLETFESHPVLYYFEGSFSLSPQYSCCCCYNHDQSGHLFKPRVFYPLCEFS